MRSLLFALLCLVLPAAVAHADTIDDFTITGGGHTITYSLPATTTTPDFSLFNSFSITAPITVDGVSVFTEQGQYYDTGIFHQLSLALNVPSSVFGFSQLDLLGPPFITFNFVPASNPAPYLPLDVVATFNPGTYSLNTTGFPSTPYSLTITPESSVVPEPGTLSLLSTGLTTFGFLATRRRSKQ